tara:strand:+ start:1327 stop:1767 length:441 start_codon:yes stop_codon:yes gene_type:complete
MSIKRLHLKTTIFILALILNGCYGPSNIDERLLLQRKVEAFIFLSDYHHQLHIMIDEEEGDKLEAFLQFKNASILKTNVELIPVKSALERIKDVHKDTINVKRLDDLVDYYQSGLSIQIEAILKGYGYKENLDTDTIMKIYDDSIN